MDGYGVVEEGVPLEFHLQDGKPPFVSDLISVREFFAASISLYREKIAMTTSAPATVSSTNGNSAETLTLSRGDGDRSSFNFVVPSGDLSGDETLDAEELLRRRIGCDQEIFRELQAICR